MTNAGDEAHVQGIAPQESIEAELVELRARVAALELALEQVNIHPGRGVQPLDLRSDAQQIYRSLIEQIPALTYVSALDDASTTLYISPQVESLLGYTVDEWMQDPTRWEHMLHPEDRQRALDDLRRSQQSDARFVSEYRLFRRDGRLIWMRDESVMVRDAMGQPAFLQGVALDITDLRESELERLELERRLLQAQKQESLGVLAGGVAHDFNNLLMTILGNTSLGLADAPSGSAVEMALSQIEIAAQRAAHLTQQMLDFTGKSLFRVQPVNINKLILSMSHVLAACVSDSIALHYELSDHMLLFEGDAGQIQQVVMNLVLNAVEAIGEHAGTVTIRTRMVANGNATHVLLEVSDTGCGMDDMTLVRIFEPFFTTKFSGRGLGLAATQGIVRAHGGTINVESRLGRGSVFRIHVPMVAVPLHGAAPKPKRQHGQRVLIIDDEAGVRGVAARMIERQGYQALTAEDGLSGINCYLEHAHEIGCVLIDLTMPIMGGREVCERLRAINPELPLVLMSGYTEHEISARLAGFSVTVLQKPFGIAALRAAIDGALSQ